MPIMYYNVSVINVSFSFTASSKYVSYEKNSGGFGEFSYCP